jgi:hypothetical protein
VQTPASTKLPYLENYSLRSRFVAAGLVFFVALIWFNHLAQARLLDGDEGFYAMAAKLVAAGRQPYLDFFYPQAPVLPYLYAWGAQALAQLDWQGLRMLSAVAAAGSTSVVFMWAARAFGFGAAIVAALLCAFHPLVLSEFTLVKSYALTSLLLLKAGYVAVFATSPLWFVCAGLLFGLAVACRLYVVLLLPILFAYLFFCKGQPRQLSRILHFTLGCMLGLLPVLYFWIADPTAFQFNNFVYHFSRDENSYSEQLLHRIHVLFVTFGLRESPEVNHFLFSGLLGLGLFSVLRRNTAAFLPVLIGVTLVLVSLLPSPPYVQYFSLAVPWLAIGAAALVGRGSARSLLAVFLVIICASMPVLKKYEALTQSGEGLLGIEPEHAEKYSLAAVREANQNIQNWSGAGAEVLALWPGYLVDGPVWPVAGFENQFAHKIASRFTGAAQQKRFHLSTLRAAKSIAMKQTHKVIVADGIFSVPLTPVLNSADFECTERGGAILCRSAKPQHRAG